MKNVYITYYLSDICLPKDTKKLDLWDAFFDDIQPIAEPIDFPRFSAYAETRTIVQRPEKVVAKSLPSIIACTPSDMSYYEFKIPKHSGGYRTISAPNPDLKAAQSEALKTLQRFSCAQHNAAFAYVHKRSCADALKVHQKNNSNWFMKVDLKNFFPSCTEKFVKEQMSQIYPYCLVPEQDMAWLYNICFLDGKLPQGAPTSPMLSNLIMIPFDYQINKELYNHNKHHFVYTRYADDILISCRETFDPAEITAVLEKIFKETPLKINKDKTRYGSKAGHNWNLGLVLNKDNNITVGYQRKRYLKNSIHNFMRDYTPETSMSNSEPPNPWPLADLYHLLGELSYIHSIEPNATANYDKTVKQIALQIKNGKHT